MKGRSDIPLILSKAYAFYAVTEDEEEEEL